MITTEFFCCFCCRNFAVPSCLCAKFFLIVLFCLIFHIFFGVHINHLTKNIIISNQVQKVFLSIVCPSMRRQSISYTAECMGTVLLRLYRFFKPPVKVFSFRSIFSAGIRLYSVQAVPGGAGAAFFRLTVLWVWDIICLTREPMARVHLAAGKIISYEK